MKEKQIKTYRPFKKGSEFIPKGRYARFRAELMTAWGIKGKTAWYQRLRGEKPLSPCEIEAAEKIFAKYGVTKNNIWGK